MYLYSVNTPESPRHYLFFPLFSALFHLTFFSLMLAIPGKEPPSEPDKKEELVAFVDLNDLVPPPPEMVEAAPAAPPPIEADLSNLLLSSTGGGTPGVLPAPPESIQEKFLIPEPLSPGIGAGLDDGIGTPLILPGEEEDPLPPPIEEVLPSPEPSESLPSEPEGAATSEESDPLPASEPVASDEDTSPPEPEASGETLAETENASAPIPPAPSNDPDALADHSKPGLSPQNKVLAKKASPPPKPSKEKIKKVGLLGLLGPKKKGGKFSRPLLSKKLPNRNKQTNPAGTGKKSLLSSSETGQQFARIRKGVIAAEQRKLIKKRGGNRRGVSGGGSGRRITITPGSGGGGVISAATHKNSGRLISIYNNLLQRNPNLQGNLIVEFVISPEGKVVKCHVLTSSLGNADFEKSLVEEILRWKFPAVERGSTTVLYPLSFFPSG